MVEMYQDKLAFCPFIEIFSFISYSMVVLNGIFFIKYHVID